MRVPRDSRQAWGVKPGNVLLLYKRQAGLYVYSRPGMMVDGQVNDTHFVRLERAKDHILIVIAVSPPISMNFDRWWLITTEDVFGWVPLLYDPWIKKLR